ncbi:MAG: DUF3440 domain-containing protein [Eisenbergiella massiliensis]
MYKNGVPLSEQRLCQPYGDDQRKGLDQFRSLEPETWEKVLYRVEGVNFGNIYCRTSLLGNIKSEKPDGMTWEQYAVFLLESLGLYAPEVRDHYYRKIKKFLAWWERRPASPQMPCPTINGISGRQTPYWKRCPRHRKMISGCRLSFSETKGDVKRLFELKEICRHHPADIQSTNKQLREAAGRIEDEFAKEGV